MKESLIFKDLKVDHFAFLCADLTSSYYLNFYSLLSWEVFHEEHIALEGTDLKLLRSNKENFFIELISPSSPESPLSKSLSKRGECFHHICYKVDNLSATILELTKENINILPNYPRIGSRNKKICFLNPKETGGILVELAESPSQ